MTRISVITVNLNHKEGLLKTIESVINQTDLLRLEYLIIDGGSSDGSQELIRNYEPFLSYWVSEPDRGIYDAMNKGISRATGDYLIFLNAGDLFANQNVLQHSWTQRHKNCVKTARATIFTHLENMDCLCTHPHLHHT